MKASGDVFSSSESPLAVRAQAEIVHMWLTGCNCAFFQCTCKESTLKCASLQNCETVTPNFARPSMWECGGVVGLQRLHKSPKPGSDMHNVQEMGERGETPKKPRQSLALRRARLKTQVNDPGHIDLWENLKVFLS